MVVPQPDRPQDLTGRNPRPDRPGPGGLVSNQILAPMYRSDDGGAFYVRKIQQSVYIFGEHPGQGYSVAISGTLNGNTISGNYWDLPKFHRTEKGSITIRIENQGQRLVVQNASGNFGVSTLEPFAIPNHQLPRAHRPPGFYATSVNDLDGAWRTSGANLYIREVGGQIVGWQENDFSNGSKPALARLLIGSRSGSGNPVLSYVDLPKGISSSSGNNNYTVEDRFHLRRLGGEKWYRDVLDVEKFEDEIVARFKDKCVGFGYAIAQEGNIVAADGWGSRRLPVDGLPLLFDGDTQKGTQSTTKTITAAAVMHLLNAKGKSVDDKIEPYLPSNWQRGPGVEFLTFKHLLTHRSGLTDVGDPDEYANLKQAIQVGPSNQNWISPAYEYQNCNFAMFRVIIPYLENKSDMLNFESNGLSDPSINERCSERYRDYVRQHILLPAGLSNPQAHYTSNNVAYSYNFANQNVAGYPVQDGQLYEMGAGSWVLSARDYAKFLAALESGDLIPKSSVNQMKSSQMGIFATTSDLGTAYNHGGSLGGGSEGAYGSGRGARAHSMLFPNHVQVFITINSANNIDPAESSGGRGEGLRAAFNAALYPAN